MIKLDLEWIPVSGMSSNALVAQRTNLAPHRSNVAIMNRLMEIQKELDDRLDKADLLKRQVEREQRLRIYRDE